MTQVASRIGIQAPATAIWQELADFGAAAGYLAGVVTCTVCGDGVGARRTLTSTDGSTIVERLEALDVNAQRLSYALLTDTPFRNCVTTITLRELGPSQAELEWSATFQPDGLPASEAVALLDYALAANCLALKQFMEVDRK